MIDRCRKCDHEVAAGCLPAATCGLYFVSLMGLATGLLVGLVSLARRVLSHGGFSPRPRRQTPRRRKRPGGYG
ncbi:MAG: hypothetical protein MUF18_21235 [Fimbriiglobus sp.]|nr:hypothetical protein [Fimbriiglobus sp.]